MYSTEFRMFDARLGRWLSLDPLMDEFPWMSPFVGMDNNPISLMDPLGLFASYSKALWYKLRHGLKGDIKQGKDGLYMILTKKLVYKAGDDSDKDYRQSDTHKNDGVTESARVITKKSSKKKGSSKGGNILTSILNAARRLDRRLDSGYEHKSRTGIKALDNFLNNMGGMNVTTDGDGNYSNGRYTDTKEQIETVDVSLFVLHPYAGKSYKQPKPEPGDSPLDETAELFENLEKAGEAGKQIDEGIEGLKKKKAEDLERYIDSRMGKKVFGNKWLYDKAGKYHYLPWADRKQIENGDTIEKLPNGNPAVW